MMTKTRIAVGDFIEIPAWRVTGCVVAVRASDLGTARAQMVCVESVPDDPLPQWYRLEPNEFTFVD